ncbi:integrase [Corynebacterium phoceense]|uniref:Integrase n=2 Tax=Corynebacterium phoceense TaxID=1686286 RepID=A0A540R9N6_9CORY|nr:tyrosine-type recombinase/integrase [Corynebacterium sp. HMSC077B05]OFL77024.1 integrase [Corynebacterium sp. HMSC077B05]TQE44446.1 integrase [Corynebacterium phoceense]
MARRKLKVGELGTINFVRLEHRKWRARAYTRNFSGERIQVQGTGPTKDAAHASLINNAKVSAYTGASEGISASTKLIDLVERTLQGMRTGEVGHNLRVQSINTYERQLSLLRGEREEAALGNLELSDCTITVVHSWLEQLSRRTPTNGKQTKALLSHAFDLAMRHGVDLWATNPARGAKLHVKQDDSGPVALSLSDIAAIWDNVQAWQTDRKKTDLVGIVGALMATGFRPQEVLGLQWADVDLSASPATVTLTGTLVRQDGKLVRQGYTKTKAGFRVVKLPNWFREMLLDRAVNADSLLVFPNERGGMLDIVNVRTRWREARGAAFSHVMLKSFRSSVATAIERASGVEDAARQLGHTSPAITARHYVAIAADAGDNTAILELFAPGAREM